MSEGIPQMPMVTPEPLIDCLGSTVASLPDMGGSDTVVRGVMCARLALWYLGRRGAATDGNDRLRADTLIDMLLDAVANSSSGRKLERLVWSKSSTSSVYTFDRPFGALDERLAETLNFSLIVKEYRSSDGAPDTRKLTAVADLYKDLYYEGKRFRGFPLSEITARTNRRILSRRSGALLAYEYAPSHPEEHVQLAADIAKSTSTLAGYLQRHPRHSEHATPDDYEGKLVKRGMLLLQHLNADGSACLRKHLATDAERIAKLLVRSPLVPHIDPTSKNIIVERDGALRYIDLEKTVEMLVNPHHLYAHIWFDPSYSLFLGERVRGLGEEGLPAAAYYSLSRVSRALSGRLRSPFSVWDKHVENRFLGHVYMLQDLGSLLKSEYPSLGAFTNLSLPSLQQSFLLQMKYHRDA